MRKISVFNKISLDGYFAGANGEIDWFGHDSEVGEIAHEMGEAEPPDTVLFGRVTYEMFASFWPNVTPESNVPDDMRKMADELNQMTKVVFSTTLKEVNWKNSRLVRGDVAHEVRILKRAPAGSITIFGSGSIVQQLANEDLIDEYLLVVVPVVLGAGKPLFKDVKKLNLELVESRVAQSGSVLLRYQRAATEVT
jgi:dihydrofolate reductase